MPSKSNTVVILQVDEHAISGLWADVTPKGLVIRAHHVSRGAWLYADGTLADALRAFAKEHAIAGQDVCFVIPRHDTTARIVSLPSHDATELIGMVRLCAEEYTPYRAEELVCGQCILHKKTNGESNVLAVFVQQEVVDGYIALLRTAGLEPDSIFFSSACLASAAIAARPSSNGPYALVNLASGGLEVLIINGAHVEHARGVAAPHDWTLTGPTAGEAIEELVLEVRASLSAHARENEEGLVAEEIYISSDGTDIEAARVALEEAIGKPCHKAEFARRVVTEGADKLASLPLVAIGAALTAQGRAVMPVSLESNALRQGKHARVARQQLIRRGGLAVAILLGLVLLYAQAHYQRMSYLQDLDAQIEAIRPQARELIEKQRQLGIIQEQVDRSASAMEALAIIADAAPQGRVNIKRFQYERDKVIRIEGRGVSESVPYDFADRLRDAGKERFPLLSAARGAGTTRDREMDQDVWNYTIEIPFPTEAPEDGQTSTSEEGPNE